MGDDVETHGMAQLWADGMEWVAVGEQYGISGEAARKRVQRAALAGRVSKPARVEGAAPIIQGVTAIDHLDIDEVWRKAEAEWRREHKRNEKRESQRITFAGGPVCLLFMADLHLGSKGVNYPRLRRELEIIEAMPNTWVFLVGDLLDNFIMRWATSIRHDTSITVAEEWAMTRSVLGQVGPQLVACVGGNHDAWSRKMAGVDMLAEAVAAVNPKALYDADDCRVAVDVGDATWRLRARHKWLGRSIYNPTHGQERAARWDKDAEVYIGAHTHVAGCARSFTVGGRTCMAIQCGSYKEHDPYVREQGFSLRDNSTAVGLVLTEAGHMMAVENVELAAEVMEGLT